MTFAMLVPGSMRKSTPAVCGAGESPHHARPSIGEVVGRLAYSSACQFDPAGMSPHRSRLGQIGKFGLRSQISHGPEAVAFGEGPQVANFHAGGDATANPGHALLARGRRVDAECDAGQRDRANKPADRLAEGESLRLVSCVAEVTVQQVAQRPPVQPDESAKPVQTWAGRGRFPSAAR